jgi:hypothetical protein
MPSTFRWTIHNHDGILGRIVGTVDMQWFSANTGNNAGFGFEGEFEGRDVSGRGHIEYSDREH